MAARSIARAAKAHTPSPQKHRHKKVTGHQRLVYREIFNRIDADGSGGLDTDELVDMFKALEVTIERDRVAELVEQYAELYHESDDDDDHRHDDASDPPSPTHKPSRIDFDQFVMMARDLADAGEIDKRALKGLVPESAAALAPPDSLEGRRLRAKRLYDSLAIQFGVAALIFANFIINAAEAQAVEATTRGADGFDATTFAVFRAFEYFFTVVFLVELALNMFANAAWRVCPGAACARNEFWTVGWNVFDFVIVAVSVVSLFLSDLPGVSVLRLLRAFRVFRLFKRLPSLAKIVVALNSSIPGVTNAFALLILVMGIYAILAVTLFGRQFSLHFGTFARAMFTLFQVMTGDSWAEVIARPIVARYPPSAAYFLSFVLIQTIVLQNVAVAVLLDKMQTPDDDDDDDDGEEAAALAAPDDGAPAAPPALPDASDASSSEPTSVASFSSRYLSRERQREKSARAGLSFIGARRGGAGARDRVFFRAPRSTHVFFR